MPRTREDIEADITAARQEISEAETLVSTGNEEDLRTATELVRALLQNLDGLRVELSTIET